MRRSTVFLALLAFLGALLPAFPADATDWINVKHRWSLTVDSTEKSALSSMLNAC